MSGFSGAAGRIQEIAARIKAEAESAKAQAEAAAKSILKKVESADTGAGPVGEGDYIVGAGDCISSIAKDKGYFWKTLWDANPTVSSMRKDPNVLLPGDRLTLPTKRLKQTSGATEMRHRFVRKGEPSRFRMQAKIEGEPLANAEYSILIDGKTQDGVTDAQGWIDVAIPGNARRGALTIMSDGQTFSYSLNFGHMEPISEPTGIQKRLTNLGYPCGTLDGKIGPMTKAAIARFQRDHGHPKSTGEIDEATKAMLLEKHGC